MDATSLLVDRLGALRERLNMADAAAGAAPAFATAIADRRKRLDDAIEGARASADGCSSTNDCRLTGRWRAGRATVPNSGSRSRLRTQRA